MPHVETDSVITFFNEDHPFSNWHKCQFTVGDDTYNCVEQFMMAEKALLFDDDECRRKILLTTSQKAMKMLGRKVSGFSDDMWNDAKYDIVSTGVRAKIEQNQYIKDLLVASGDKIIAEASPYDKIWGTGKDINVTDPTKWIGQNLLGKILMDIRREL